MKAVAPFWRAVGMTYIGYSKMCADMVRSCLKEPYKSEAAEFEKVHYSRAKWSDGKQPKTRKHPKTIKSSFLASSISLASSFIRFSLIFL
ncbi:ATP synthase subunit epsilon, mitochondrial [Hordeum vulgare]|nr:ATP synthase subunit epsilon, mitochondrial [Hordeum vulgare]